MTKVFNTLNAGEMPKKPQMFTMPSMTVPDQSMSARELLRRYQSGEAGKAEVWEDGDTNGINPKTLDLVDLQEMAMANKSKVEALRDNLKAWQAEEQKKEVQKLIEEQP